MHYINGSRRKVLVESVMGTWAHKRSDWLVGDVFLFYDLPGFHDIVSEGCRCLDLGPRVLAGGEDDVLPSVSSIVSLFVLSRNSVSDQSVVCALMGIVWLVLSRVLLCVCMCCHLIYSGRRTRVRTS